MRILALWGGVRSTGNPVGSLLLGMGRADLMLKWNLALLAIAPPALWFGSTRGPEGMAWAMLAVAAVLFVPAWLVLVRPVCHAGLLEYGVAALKPFLLASVALTPARLAADVVDGAVLRLTCAAALAIPLYVGVSYLANRRWLCSMLELVGGTVPAGGRGVER